MDKVEICNIALNIKSFRINRGKLLLTNIGNAWIEYTVDVTDADW